MRAGAAVARVSGAGIAVIAVRIVITNASTRVRIAREIGWASRGMCTSITGIAPINGAEIAVVTIRR